MSQKNSFSVTSTVLFLLLQLSYTTLTMANPQLNKPHNLFEQEVFLGKKSDDKRIKLGKYVRSMSSETVNSSIGLRRSLAAAAFSASVIASNIVGFTMGFNVPVKDALFRLPIVISNPIQFLDAIFNDGWEFDLFSIEIANSTKISLVGSAIALLFGAKEAKKQLGYVSKLKKARVRDFDQINPNVTAGVTSKKYGPLNPISFFIHEGTKSTRLRLPATDKVRDRLEFEESQNYHVVISLYGEHLKPGYDQTVLRKMNTAVDLLHKIKAKKEGISEITELIVDEESPFFFSAPVSGEKIIADGIPLEGLPSNVAFQLYLVPTFLFN